MTNDVVFYYQLKMIHPNGFFAKGSISQLNTILPYSQSGIWKKLKRLVELQLIRKNANGYQLISYDGLFKSLGYDLEWDGKRHGKFKIHKVPFVDCTNLKHLFAFLDIRDNLNVQTKRAFNTIKRTNQYPVQNLYCTGMEQKQMLLTQIVKLNLIQMVKSNDDNKQLTDFIEADGSSFDNKHCNPDITLSLKGVCRILGLTNTSSANMILKQLKDQNRLKVNRRELFLETTHLSDREARKKFGDSYGVRHNMLYRTLSNKITCIRN